MSKFNQSNSPVNSTATTKLSKAILKHIKVFANDSKQTKEYRIERIKNAFSNYIKAVVEQPNNELMIVSNGELRTSYFINFPETI